MKKLGLFVIILMMAATAWSYFKAHSDQPDNPIEKLVLTGSSTVAPLASEIAKSFESLHPNVRIDVQTGGSSRGINDARSGLANIGMASRALKENETDLLSACTNKPFFEKYHTIFMEYFLNFNSAPQKNHQFLRIA